MTHDPEVLKAECTLAVARALEDDPAVLDPWAFACSMFFAAVDALSAEPRSLIVIATELAQFRARRAVADTFRNATPARRKSDADHATLDADLAAEAQRAREAQRDRERERRQRAGAHQLPWE